MAIKPSDFSQNLSENSFTDFFFQNYDHITLPVPTKNFYPKAFISKRFVLQFYLKSTFCYLYTRLGESKKESICYIS